MVTRPPAGALIGVAVLPAYLGSTAPLTLVIGAISPPTLFIEGFDIDGELIVTGVAWNIEVVVGNTPRGSISLQLVGSGKVNGNAGNP